MKRIIFIDGLPGVGKSTLIEHIKAKNIVGVLAVEEIINPKIKNNINTPNAQDIYLENDLMKINKYDVGFIIIDRSPVSTIAYNLTRKALDKSFNNINPASWQKIFGKFFQDSEVMVYYLKNPDEYFCPYDNPKDPYGSVENQKLLEQATLKVLRNSVKNYKLVEYHKSDMKELANEIINQFMCS